MAFDFDSTTGYVSRATTPITATPISIACWCTADITSGRVLGGIGSSTASGGFMIGTTSGGLNFYAQTEAAGTAVRSLSASAYTAGTIYHVAGTFASATDRLVYQDGVAGTVNATSKTPVSLDTTCIGIYIRSAVATSFWDGRIWEFGIWNVVLDAARTVHEVMDLSFKHRLEILLHLSPRNFDDDTQIHGTLCRDV